QDSIHAVRDGTGPCWPVSQHSPGVRGPLRIPLPRTAADGKRHLAGRRGFVLRVEVGLNDLPLVLAKPAGLNKPQLLHGPGAFPEVLASGDSHLHVSRGGQHHPAKGPMISQKRKDANVEPIAPRRQRSPEWRAEQWMAPAWKTGVAGLLAFVPVALMLPGI